MDKKSKRTYTTPKITRLGKLSSLIQGISGNTRDAYPQQGTKMGF